MSRRRISPISTLILLVAVGLVLGPAYAQPSPTTTRVYLPQLSDGKIPFSFGVALPRELLGAKRPLPGSGPLLEGTLFNSTGDLGHALKRDGAASAEAKQHVLVPYLRCACGGPDGINIHQVTQA